MPTTKVNQNFEGSDIWDPNMLEFGPSLFEPLSMNSDLSDFEAPEIVLKRPSLENGLKRLSLEDGLLPDVALKRRSLVGLFGNDSLTNFEDKEEVIVPFRPSAEAMQASFLTDSDVSTEPSTRPSTDLSTEPWTAEAPSLQSLSSNRSQADVSCWTLNHSQTVTSGWSTNFLRIASLEPSFDPDSSLEPFSSTEPDSDTISSLEPDSEEPFSSLGPDSEESFSSLEPDSEEPVSSLEPVDGPFSSLGFLDGDVPVPEKKPEKKPAAQIACQACCDSKIACGHTRPCHRCVRLKKECIARVPRKKGRPRKRKVEATPTLTRSTKGIKTLQLGFSGNSANVAANPHSGWEKALLGLSPSPWVPDNSANVAANPHSGLEKALPIPGRGLSPSPWVPGHFVPNLLPVKQPVKQKKKKAWAQRNAGGVNRQADSQQLTHFLSSYLGLNCSSAPAFAW